MYFSRNLILLFYLILFVFCSCSASCCKSHKETGCEPYKAEPSIEDVPKLRTSYDFPTEDTVPLEKLELLKGSEEVQACLKNPHVRDIVKAILNDINPTEAIRLAMMEPIFVELADACLKVVETSDEKKPC